jgi:hypothetical protein
LKTLKKPLRQGATGALDAYLVVENPKKFHFAMALSKNLVGTSICLELGCHELGTEFQHYACTEVDF